MLSLRETLDLVGSLDDSPGEDTARSRFRSFLARNVRESGQVRDFVEEALRESGDQYNRALQDLVNHIARLLDFDVSFGRYRGVQNEIGYDGHWESPTGFHVVAETKKTEAYAIKTSALLGYINELVDEGDIPDRSDSLGLYIVGKPESDLRQLRDAIVANKLSSRLRIISVDSLMSLLELYDSYDVSHSDVLGLIMPAGPEIDPVVQLISRLVAEQEVRSPEKDVDEPESDESDDQPSVDREPRYWLAPAKATEEASAVEHVLRLVRDEGIWAFGDRTPGRKHLKKGDWMCFYATGGKGVIAHGRISEAPKNEPHPAVERAEEHPWTFHLTDVEVYEQNPVVIDADVRSRLEAFEGKDPEGHWAWFVQSTSELTEHDFKELTRRSG